MKNLLVSMNSKYIHSSLGAWYLKASAKAENIDVEVMQCTINDSIERVLANIYVRRPNILAFSCYIWNIKEVLWLCENVKKLTPEVVIILGGPEVSFDSMEVLINNSSVDYIIRGEGEEGFPKLLRAIENKLSVIDIPSICYRNKDGIFESPVFGIVHDLDHIPSPYTKEMLSVNSGKIFYFEASRGCPFNCAYCLSSTFEGVRYFSMSRVQNELELIVASGAKQIKFVDRTFNANKKRAKEILEYVLLKFGHLKDINFHFEVAADLFDDELIELIKKFPEGLIQFEIGVQSTNEQVLDAVKRKTDTTEVFRYLERLIQTKNVNVHADLIAGLPKEDLASFANSFEELYSRKPHQLQLGFLKLLRGSGIRREYQKYDYVFKSTPPYEVLCNNVLTFDNILELKVVEEMVERLYNSNRYRKSLNYIIKCFGKGAYGFFRDFGRWYEETGHFEIGVSAREFYSLLLEFSESIPAVNSKLLVQLLIFDFLSVDNTGNIPSVLKYEADKTFREKCFEFLKNPVNIDRLLPHFHDKSAKEIYKNVYFFRFNYNLTNEDSFLSTGNVLLFDYTSKDRVLGLYLSFLINF